MSRWEVWAEPWIGYTVVKRRHDDGFCTGYRYARNFLRLHKFFLSFAAAQRYADKLNAKESP